MKKNKIISVAKFIAKRPKNHNFEVFETISLFGHIFKYYFDKLYYILLKFRYNAASEVKKIKYLNQNRKISAKIHFLLGIDAIKTNKLYDAIFRFWLVSKFINNSATLFYHLSLLYYLKGDIEKSIFYLFKIKEAKKYKTKRVQELVKYIKKTNYDILLKTNYIL